MRASVEGSKCSSIYSNTSSMPVCAALPTDQSEWNRSPFVRAHSMINSATPPEAEMRSTPPGPSVGTGDVKTAWWCGLASPMQFGPISAAPAAVQMRQISRSMAAPSVDSSLKPAEMMMMARAPFSSTNTRTASVQCAAETASTPSSMPVGRSFTLRVTGCPWIRRSFGLTMYKSPVNGPSIKFFTNRPPGLCMWFDPPMTAIDRGLMSACVII